jgi:hypothetical protein
LGRNEPAHVAKPNKSEVFSLPVNLFAIDVRKNN